MNQKTLVGVIVGICLLAVGCGAQPPIDLPTQPVSTATGMVDQTPTAISASPQETPTATQGQETAAPASGSIPDGWISLSEPKLDYQIAYPAEWEICSTTGQSRLFCQADSEGPSFPVFYITVIPNGFTNSDAEAYNFIPAETLRSFENIAIGSSAATDANPEYSTFTRLEDVSVGWKNFIVIENSQIWEAPNPETRDRRVILATDDNVYMLGTYYDNPNMLEIFEAVLATFEISG